MLTILLTLSLGRAEPLHGEPSPAGEPGAEAPPGEAPSGEAPAAEGPPPAPEALPPAAEAPAGEAAEQPPEQRFSITALSHEPAQPPAGGPLLQPGQLQELLKQLESGQIPILDPAALQDPSEILLQLSPEQAARIEAAQLQAMRDAEAAARAAGEAVRGVLEAPGAPLEAPGAPLEAPGAPPAD